MNVIKSGGIFQIYGDTVEPFNELPVDTYELCFHKQMGFFLTTRDDLRIGEEKIYGSTEYKVEKIFKSYNLVQRNFGIILSGPKGVGKTLFTRVLAEQGIAHKLPLIIVNDYYPGIANFISSIKQEVIVIFDEFEKTFGEKNEGDFRPQDEMLTLFDGLDSGKKMFVITCNNLRKLNDCLMNRPGRFHYHFAMTPPNPDEITEYMHDKLNEEYWGEIESVIQFSLFTDITYDVLRAITFELNQGYPFKECLNDLNVNKGNTPYYRIRILWDNGEEATLITNLDIWETRIISYWFDCTMNGLPYEARIEFEVGNLQYNANTGGLYGNPIKVRTTNVDSSNNATDIEDEILKTRRAKSIEFIRQMDNQKLARYLDA